MESEEDILHSFSGSNEDKNVNCTGSSIGNSSSEGVQITCFTEDIHEGLLHFQVIRLQKQTCIWIGYNTAKFGHLYAAAPTRPNNLVTPGAGAQRRSTHGLGTRGARSKRSCCRLKSANDYPVDGGLPGGALINPVVYRARFGSPAGPGRSEFHRYQKKKKKNKVRSLEKEKGCCPFSLGMGPIRSRVGAASAARGNWRSRWPFS